VFFGSYFTQTEDGWKIDMSYVWNTLVRTANLMLYFWVLMLAMQYSLKAGLNFGVISSCAYVSIIINSVFRYYAYQEVITRNQFIGIGLTLTGVIWISVAKGDQKVGPVLEEDGDIARY
jgi:multidrug transporter EmrE-like cation transporter